MALLATALQAEPRKLLVVTTTTGFRHSSIPTAERVLQQLAQQSQTGFEMVNLRLSLAKSTMVSQRRTGFKIDFVHQPPGKPDDLKPNATAEQKAAFKVAEDQWDQSLKAALQKLSPESLKNYDGVLFASTTGDLPIPDPQGLLDWIKAGHAFIGVHAASDTFHHWPAYADMLGGEFKQHGRQVSVDCLNQDPQNPATAPLPETWTISQEEIYQFQNYSPAKVHDLLIMAKHPEDGSPGHFAVSWCKSYGAGRVFYTSLGHREDIWDTDATLKDRRNSPEISKQYQAHVLGGIEWALGLKGAPVNP